MSIRVSLPSCFIAVAALGWLWAPAIDARQKAVAKPVALSADGVRGSLVPGGVGLVSVTASRPLGALDGRLGEQIVRFWPVEGQSGWRGLVGIGLEAGPGPQSLALHAVTVDGSTATLEVTLTVTAKRYETRRLQVAQGFVDPPADEAARIAEDTRLMAEAFALVTPERRWRGPFLAPVPGASTSSFGRLSIMNGQSRGRHQGADFRAGQGTRVVAPNSGRVILARDLYFAGNTVILDHGLGVFSLLAHLSRIAVAVGDEVAKGEPVGLSGATGRVTGPHLHWAVRFGSMSVDPLALMDAVAGVAEGPAAAPDGT